MDNYIKLMADYTSTGLWDIRGRSVDPSYLPVSDELHERIARWTDAYELNDDYLPEEFRSGKFNTLQFSNEGANIARSIKIELPHWTVTYFDEELFEQGYNNPNTRINPSYEVK
jgi:hypothetical protein